MRLHTKKIIAREFLILTMAIFIGLFCFLGTYLYNYLKRNKIDTLNENISQKLMASDSLRKSYDQKISKQQWFFDKYFDKVNRQDEEFNSRDKLWKRLDFLALKDSIKYKWQNVWTKDLVGFVKENGFSNGDDFNSFIVSNRITNDDVQGFNQSLQIKTEIKNLTSEKENTTKRLFLSFEQQLKFGVTSFVVALIILFGLRYIFYAIRWSIKTLKQANE